MAEIGRAADVVAAVRTSQHVDPGWILPHDAIIKGISSNLNRVAWFDTPLLGLLTMTCWVSLLTTSS
jgi:hypothetical protein